MARTYPDSIESVEQLEDLLSEPTEEVIQTLGRLEGDLVILGVGGKMGPTLARMAQRASALAGVRRRIIGVSRFSSAAEEARLQAAGIDTLRCDLLDPAQLERLPESANVVFMTGMKFGSTGQEGLTWAMNAVLPALVSRKYAHSRIVAFSTGNVYGLAPVRLGGSVETDPLAPVGEYAMSCLGRERVFEHFSRTLACATAFWSIWPTRSTPARPSTCTWGTSTSSGRPTPTPWPCARSSRCTARRGSSTWPDRSC
jgi:hypothetical protein